MADTSWVAKKTVTGDLRDSDVQKIKSFSFGGIGFDPKTFPLLADFIDRGQIKVEYDSEKGGMAEYDYKTNTIVLGFTWCLDSVKDALIIHECTHAVYDVAKTKMSTAISESIAYIVQCQYLLVKRGDGKRLTSPNKAKDLVFELAWKIAAKLQNGQSVDLTDKSNLQEAVSKHPFYMGKSAGDAGFDGV
ncbi:MAG: hypothetical protein IPN69_06665 [Acidobacteria bacterium]|nr:hypothetical protein [Acidobacteriota bacterium]MBK8147241.1 hypothetical protein [Acidobacteriota bacterium]MBK8810404.1 hypothetical protein [Acidobacteriota bacterium]